MLDPCPTPAPSATIPGAASGRQWKTTMSARTRPQQAAPYRTRRLALADGETLVLGGDGTIERRDASDEPVERWPVDDPGWPAQALRFGVRPSPTTVPPRGRDVPGTKPPA